MLEEVTLDTLTEVGGADGAVSITKHYHRYITTDNDSLSPASGVTANILTCELTVLLKRLSNLNFITVIL